MLVTSDLVTLWLAYTGIHMNDQWTVKLELRGIIAEVELLLSDLKLNAQIKK